MPVFLSAVMSVAVLAVGGLAPAFAEAAASDGSWESRVVAAASESGSGISTPLLVAGIVFAFMVGLVSGETVRRRGRRRRADRLTRTAAAPSTPAVEAAAPAPAPAPPPPAPKPAAPQRLLIVPPPPPPAPPPPTERPQSKSPPEPRREPKTPPPPKAKPPRKKRPATAPRVDLRPKDSPAEEQRTSRPAAQRPARPAKRPPAKPRPRRATKPPEARPAQQVEPPVAEPVERPPAEPVEQPPAERPVAPVARLPRSPAASSLSRSPERVGGAPRQPGARPRRLRPWPPEAATVWTCEIEWKPGYRKSSFRAMASPPGGRRARAIGETPGMKWGLMADPEPPTRELVEAVRSLLSALEAAGWHRIEPAGPWYAQRFLWHGHDEPGPVEPVQRNDAVGA
jgi:hypothetical protein